jgi:hypothetical protein
MLRKKKHFCGALLLTSWLSIFALASCQTAPAKTVMPPLPDPPLLSSMVADKNDKTGELGLWQSVVDAQAEAEWRERVRSYKNSFNPNEEGRK